VKAHRAEANLLLGFYESLSQCLNLGFWSLQDVQCQSLSGLRSNTGQSLKLLD
jgi:hypothetical protein